MPCTVCLPPNAGKSIMNLTCWNLVGNARIVFSIYSCPLWRFLIKVPKINARRPSLTFQSFFLRQRPIPRIPDKSEAIQSSNSIRCNMSRLALFEEFVLPSLMVHPSCKLRHLRKVCWDQTSAKPGLEVDQLVKSFTPGGLVCVPAKTESVEGRHSIWAHVRFSTLFH